MRECPKCNRRWPATLVKRFRGTYHCHRCVERILMKEETTMCVSGKQHEKDLAAMKATIDKPITEGEWIIKGNRYKVLSTGYHYMKGQGDSTTEYYTLEQPGTNGKWLLTAFRFEREAKRPAPRPKLFVTYGQLLAAGPCPDGLGFIAEHAGMGLSGTENLMYSVTRRIIAKGLLNNSLSVGALYEFYRKANGEDAPDSWLRFVAEVLNLVPKGMHHGRSTLLRLLGIED